MTFAYLRVLLLRMRRRGLFIVTAFLPIVTSALGALAVASMREDLSSALAKFGKTPERVARINLEYQDDLRADEVRIAAFLTLFMGGLFLLNGLCEMLNEERRRGQLRQLHLAGLMGVGPVAGLVAIGMAWALAFCLLGFVGPLAASLWVGAGSKGFGLAFSSLFAILAGLVPVALLLGLHLPRVPALVASNVALLAVGIFVLLESGGNAVALVAVGVLVLGTLALAAGWSRSLRSVA